MGSAIRAKCECGYDQEFLIGGGMSNFEELCLFPCLCRECKAIVSANLLQNPLACPECESKVITPYGQGELCQKGGKKEVASWKLGGNESKRLSLTDGAYYCPPCNSFGLTFEDSGFCWD